MDADPPVHVAARFGGLFDRLSESDHGQAEFGASWVDEVQEARAIRYDPYPEPDIGPNVEGVRPRSYDKPLAETERGRWYLGDWQ